MVNQGDGSNKAVSRHGIASGIKRDGDVWYDMDTFLFDQVEEVLAKLSDGSIDDGIWGKIVVMEKNKRVAKAYLRHATVIVDGSDEDFDGKTLGFNAFSNSERDEQTEEIRQKIKEGVILKMDLQGNIKGMSRGRVPIIAQGWRDPKHNCLSEKIIRLQGKINSDEKAYKIFDMKRWKAAVERFAEGEGEARSLLSRACIRVALAKDGGAEITRTPCWFAIVNLVALDVLISRFPAILKGSPPIPRPIVPPDTTVAVNNTAIDPTAQIPHIVAAVAAQMNQNMNTQQLAQIASAIALANQPKDQQQGKKSPIRVKKERRRAYKKDVDESSGDDSALRSQSSSSNEKLMRSSKWDDDERWKSSTQSMNIIYEGIGGGGVDQRTIDNGQEKPRGRRPRLDDVVFSMGTLTAPSSTSDYDSTKELFDSSSCSSTVSHSTKGIAEVTKSLKTHATVHKNPYYDSSPSPSPLLTAPAPPPPPPPPSLPLPSSSPSSASPPLASSTPPPPPPASSATSRPASAANSHSYGLFQNKTAVIYDRPKINNHASTDRS